MPDYVLTGHAGAGDLKIVASSRLEITASLAAAYKLSPEQAHFFKSQTGIEDDETLKTHILDVQEKAYKIFPYVCIKELLFLQLGISKHPCYPDIIKLGKERPHGIFLDVGCCFGVDARKAIADGFPLTNIVTTDLNKDFFNLGHILFQTTPESYPLSFVQGNVFDPEILELAPPPDEPPPTERPDVSMLTSLNPLLGRCAVIYASNFFHLFSEERQLHLAKALAGLLSAEPGSVICGEHIGYWQKRVYRGEHLGMDIEMFQHSPETWSAMWEREVFGEGKVKVKAAIVEAVVAGLTFERLQWSVMKL